MTTTIATNETLGDLVTADPRRARVLEKFGLDYCCGGQRTLGEAAAAAGVDATEVADALDLADPEPAPEWQSLGMGELARHVVDTHHSYLWEELKPLGELVDKVHRVHGERHPELTRVAEAYRLAVADLEPHLFKEERILFPGIERLASTGSASGSGEALRGPITQMLREHDYVGELMTEIHELTDGFTAPADGCASYQQMMSRLGQLEHDLHEHIHKENNVLFPRVLAFGA
ncbi:iron-sulfur cluster repair di-iron protein [Enemella dayhoffiae]|uniref:Iron-sulfur cluster repair di-iron protein n=1 Tax=Enemella dayhoffiae TaxID=2016507 RepID=A0A255GLG7_9ACTN|nr:iron-sulfur cluster repair di-iron protein [Enemella dayhoffiae]OYO16659.1 iron-sulfur cluster repair di-iron protein [Enemella dayhoffiae]